MLYRFLFEWLPCVPPHLCRATQYPALSVYNFRFFVFDPQNKKGEAMIEVNTIRY